SPFSRLARDIEGGAPRPESALQSSTPVAGRCVLKQCPSFRDYAVDGSLNAFEAGAGGYGYNNIYVGGLYDLCGPSAQAVVLGAKFAEIRQPSLTITFADAAYAQKLPGNSVV